jgi:uncharacterized protein YggE
METFDYKKYAWIAGTFALVGIFFATLALGISEWKSLKYPNGQTASITVFGEGEMTAVPDIATVSMTVRESAKTVPEAQRLVEAKITAAIKELSSLGVEEKDQRTLSYYVNPKYESVRTYSGGYPVYNQRIVGYEVAQTVEIKVRKVDSAGDVIGKLGAANITEISGPSFTVDDMDKVQAEAKEKAIAEAKEKATATARALGADLGAVIQFSEDNGGYYPMYARDGAMNQAAYGKGGAETMSATLPPGENIIKSRVTITYSLN